MLQWKKLRVLPSFVDTSCGVPVGAAMAAYSECSKGLQRLSQAGSLSVQARRYLITCVLCSRQIGFPVTGFPENLFQEILLNYQKSLMYRESLNDSNE